MQLIIAFVIAFAIALLSLISGNFLKANSTNIVGDFSIEQLSVNNEGYDFPPRIDMKLIEEMLDGVDSEELIAKIEDENKICEETFDEDGEFLSDDVRIRAISVANKINRNLAEDFVSGEVNFLNKEKLDVFLSKCELKIIDDLFFQDPEKYGIYFPRLKDCSENVDRKQLIFVPEDLASKSTSSRMVIPPVVPVYTLPYLTEMLTRIKSDTGRTVLVESGYRSPYFQAYVFLNYYKKFGTVVDTAKYVAFPCYSEHGTLIRPAIDIVMADGTADQSPEVFASRKEFEWLIENSREFGYFLTFFGGNRFGVGFEPWHFHFEPIPEKISDIPTPLGMKRIEAVSDWGKFIENLPLYPGGTRTKMLYRRENRKDGSEFIKSYSNYIYENYMRTFAVVNIPVSVQQDCSKHLVRLIAMYFNNDERLQFPLIDESLYKYSGSGFSDYEQWLNEAMIRIGTITWRAILPRVDKEEDVQVGDVLIEPSTTHAVDEIYGDAIIGHTAVVVGIAEDKLTGERYYLIGSGSLPITNFRIARAENRYQGQDGWLTMEGYLLRAHRDNVEFYRMSDNLDMFINK